MKSYFREAARTASRAFDFRGRATRGEFVTYLVLSQVPFVGLALLLAGTSSLTGPDSALSGTVIDAVMLGVLALVTLPLGALCIRRFHDFARSGWWSAPFLVLVCRTLLLDLIGIAAGWSVRSAIEAGAELRGLAADPARRRGVRGYGGLALEVHKRNDRRGRLRAGRLNSGPSGDQSPVRMRSTSSLTVGVKPLE